MADNQDKLTDSDQAKLEALEKQLSQKAQDTSVEPVIPPKYSASAQSKFEPRIDDKKTAPPFSSREAFVSDKAPAKAKSVFLWLVTLFNLLLIAAVIAAGYWAWLQWQNQVQQQQQLQKQQQDFIATQQAKFNAQQSEFNAQQDDITAAINANQLVKTEWQSQSQSIQTALKDLQTGIENNQLQVSANQNKLAEIAGRRPADWLLAEADYLVKIAGRKIWLEHDVDTAILMLRAADSRLEDLADPSLLPIRQYIAADIQSLQQINPVSATSIALTLKALSQQVEALPLAFFQKPQSAEQADQLSNNLDDWKSNLARSWDKFTARFFSVKKISAEVKPFMSEQQQWLAREQLKFALLSAQVAIQQENSVLFKSALETAQQQLEEFYVADDNRVKQFSSSLLTLQNTDIERVYPQQLGANEPLQDLVQQRVDGRFNNGNR